jgi:hypothetical protein
MLISPWIAKGSIIQSPKGPFPTSQFEHSSIPATIKTLFNLTDWLTRRDEWAGSFEELLLDAPRRDPMPLHFPGAPLPRDGRWGPWKKNVSSISANLTNFTADAVELRRRLLKTQPSAQHCSAERVPHEACTGSTALSEKQRKLVELYSAMTSTPKPDLSMSYEQARAWLRARWREYMDG